jgi:hypothetical protein
MKSSADYEGPEASLKMSKSPYLVTRDEYRPNTLNISAPRTVLFPDNRERLLPVEVHKALLGAFFTELQTAAASDADMKILNQGYLRQSHELPGASQLLESTTESFVASLTTATVNDGVQRVSKTSDFEMGNQWKDQTFHLNAVLDGWHYKPLVSVNHPKPPQGATTVLDETHKCKFSGAKYSRHNVGISRDPATGIPESKWWPVITLCNGHSRQLPEDLARSLHEYIHSDVRARPDVYKTETPWINLFGGYERDVVFRSTDLSTLNVETEIQRLTDDWIDEKLHQQGICCSEFMYLPTSPVHAAPYRIEFPNQRKFEMLEEEICDPARLWLDTKEDGCNLSSEDKTTMKPIMNSVLAEAARQKPTNSTPAFYAAAIARAARSLQSNLTIDLIHNDRPTSELESNVNWTIVDRYQLVDSDRHLIPFRGDERTAYGTRPEPDQYIEVRGGLSAKNDIKKAEFLSTRYTYHPIGRLDDSSNNEEAHHADSRIDIDTADVESVGTGSGPHTRTGQVNDEVSTGLGNSICLPLSRIGRSIRSTYKNMLSGGRATSESSRG